MIRYKQTQSKSNQDSIVYASEEFDRPVSSNDVKLYLDQKAFQNETLEANQRYSNGDDNDNNRFPPTTIDLFYKRISDTFEFHRVFVDIII
jgi:hypothetical protein